MLALIYLALAIMLVIFSAGDFTGLCGLATDRQQP
jgi:hypothetical protein